MTARERIAEMRRLVEGGCWCSVETRMPEFLTLAEAAVEWRDANVRYVEAERRCGDGPNDEAIAEFDLADLGVSGAMDALDAAVAALAQKGRVMGSS